MQHTPKAKLTGRTIDHPAGTLYEVICINPACQLEQVHRLGTWPCILCGTPLSVRIFHLVRDADTDTPVTLPETTENICPEETKSP